MTVSLGRRLLVGLVLAIGLVVGTSAILPASRVAAADLPTWTGGVSLYRDGVFTTQRSWLWCTAAGVQIMRNIAEGKTDHTTRSQRRYFEWMRERNRYDLPLSAGVDPAGWTAGLRHWVDDRYRLVSSRTFEGALRSAVTRLRLTGLPVALAVSHGNHGWILTGFRATADPATTSAFKVTSVRVTGPLYGLQSKNGYDMPPNTKLTTAEFRRFFTPWKYAPKAMVWDGRYVSIQPIPTVDAAEAPLPVPVDFPALESVPLASPVIGADDVLAPAPIEPVPTADAAGAIVTSPVAAASASAAAALTVDTRPAAPSLLGLEVAVLIVGVAVAAMAVGTVRRRQAG